MTKSLLSISLAKIEELRALQSRDVKIPNPMFAIFRAKLSRLTCQCWNLTKKIRCLDDHLAIYIESHNRSIWKKVEKKQLKN